MESKDQDSDENIQEPEILPEVVEEVSKKYEDFTPEDFKQHLRDTYDAKETVFEPSPKNLSKFPTFTILPRDFEGVIPPENAEKLNIAAKLRKELFTRRRDDDADSDA
jgi:hypothetical protein